MQPNPNLYGQQNNSQKIRFIIVTSIVAIVVLGIAVWAIVALVSGKNKNSTAKVDTGAVQEQTDNKQKETEKKTSDTTTESTTVVIPTKTQTVEAPKEDIPSTGPEEFLPIALVLGALTTYIGSIKLAKSSF